MHELHVINGNILPDEYGRLLKSILGRFEVNAVNHPRLVDVLEQLSPDDTSIWVVGTGVDGWALTQEQIIGALRDAAPKSVVIALRGPNQTSVEGLMDYGSSIVAHQALEVDAQDFEMRRVLDWAFTEQQTLRK